MFPAAAPKPAGVKIGVSKNSLQRVGFGLMLVYLFALISLLSGVSSEIIGVKPYVSVIAGPLAIIVCLTSGHLLRILQTRTGMFMGLFMFWLLVATPFTTWKTGTLEELTNVFLRNYSIAFMMAAFAVTLQDLKNIVTALTVSGMVVFLVTHFYGTIGNDGRFVVPIGALGNPNELAVHLLFIVSFCLILAAITTHTKTIRPLAIGVSLAMLYIALKTVSRAALIVIAVMALLVLFRGSKVQKLMVIVMTGAVLVFGAIFLPQSSWSRFATTFSDDATDQAYGVASRESRLALLERSIKVTFENPLVGVGPGTFIAEEANAAKDAGKRAAWMGTHNSYTQVSAEAGIPAFIFFVGAIVAGYLSTVRIQKRARQRGMTELASFALFLGVGIGGLSVSIFFDHIAYTYYVPVILGMAISLELVSRDLFSQMPPGLRPAGRMGGAAVPVAAPVVPVPQVPAPPVVARTSSSFRFGGVRKPGAARTQR